MSITQTLPLAAGTWTLDPAHSTVEFTVRHLGLSKVRGRFNSFDTNLQVGNDLAGSTLTASIELSSVDTNNADRDGHLQSTDFFSVESHPKMTFESATITGDGDTYAVDGTLSVNGVSKPVTLAVEFNGAEVFPFDQKTHAGFTATTTLSRKDFNIDFNVPVGVDKVMISDKVNVELEIQLVEPEG
jgi:polyisoprenoid-binding protein YceI